MSANDYSSTTTSTESVSFHDDPIHTTALMITTKSLQQIQIREAHLARKRQFHCKMNRKPSMMMMESKKTITMMNHNNNYNNMNNNYNNNNNPTRIVQEEVSLVSELSFNVKLNVDRYAQLSYDLRRKSPPLSECVLNMPRLANGLDLGAKNSFGTILRTTRLFRKILSERNPPITEVVASGLLIHYE